MFERDLLPRLDAWAHDPARKPMILNGARQVGKTTLLHMLAARSFNTHVVLNFDEDPRLHEVFAPDLKPGRIIDELRLLTGESITAHRTLLIFDEVQTCPRALTSLKYFCEQAPEYAIAAAGSLLGLMTHSGSGYPVGKVDSFTLHPLTFPEFCRAVEREDLAHLACEGTPRELELMREDLVRTLRLFYVVGGMPEAVAAHVRTRDVAEARKVQEGLIESWMRDVNKHAGVFDREPIMSVWRRIPEFLGRENKKFIFGQVTPGKRARDFAGALMWLREAGYIHEVGRVTKPGIPLSAYGKDNQFKVFTLDVGILGAMCGLPPSAAASGHPLFTEFKGALTEQYVAQQLVAMDDVEPHYWSAENSSGEIDFLRQSEGEVYAIEVKAEENLRAKSLQAFAAKYPQVLPVRLSLADHRREDALMNIPLHAVHNRALWPEAEHPAVIPTGLDL